MRLSTARFPLVISVLLLLGYLSKASAQFADGKVAYSEMLAAKAVILDVREKNEVTQGMVKGAQWIALSELNSHPDQTVRKVKALANDSKIYVYCRSGSRSAKFIDQIKDYGLKALNLGGFESLQAQGLPSQARP